MNLIYSVLFVCKSDTAMSSSNFLPSINICWISLIGYETCWDGPHLMISKLGNLHKNSLPIFAQTCVPTYIICNALTLTPKKAAADLIVTQGF